MVVDHFRCRADSCIKLQGPLRGGPAQEKAGEPEASPGTAVLIRWINQNNEYVRLNRERNASKMYWDDMKQKATTKAGPGPPGVSRGNIHNVRGSAHLPIAGAGCRDYQNWMSSGILIRLPRKYRSSSRSASSTLIDACIFH